MRVVSEREDLPGGPEADRPGEGGNRSRRPEGGRDLGARVRAGRDALRGHRATRAASIGRRPQGTLELFHEIEDVHVRESSRRARRDRLRGHVRPRPWSSRSEHGACARCTTSRGPRSPASLWTARGSSTPRPPRSTPRPAAPVPIEAPSSRLPLPRRSPARRTRRRRVPCRFPRRRPRRGRPLRGIRELVGDRRDRARRLRRARVDVSRRGDLLASLRPEVRLASRRDGPARPSLRVAGPPRPPPRPDGGEDGRRGPRGRARLRRGDERSRRDPAAPPGTPAPGSFISAAKDGRACRRSARPDRREACPRRLSARPLRAGGKHDKPDAPGRPGCRSARRRRETSRRALLPMEGRLSRTPKGESAVVERVDLSYTERNARPVLENLAVLEPGPSFRAASAGAGVLSVTNPDENGVFAGLERRTMPARPRAPEAAFRKGFRTLTWKGTDPNGDALRYEVDARGERDLVPREEGHRGLVSVLRHDGPRGRALSLPRHGLGPRLAARKRGAHGAEESGSPRRQHSSRPEGRSPQRSDGAPSWSRSSHRRALARPPRGRRPERGPLAPPARGGRRRRLACRALRLPRAEAFRGRGPVVRASTPPATWRRLRRMAVLTSKGVLDAGFPLRRTSARLVTPRSLACASSSPRAGRAGRTRRASSGAGSTASRRR